jgi:exonuclease VII small subunit
MQVEDEKIKVDKQAADVNAQFEIAMKELNEVLPILKSAEEALNTLNN